MTTAVNSKQKSADRQQYKDRIAKLGLAPLWDQYHDLLTLEPASKTVAHLWVYAELREILLEAGTLISAKEAQRRVLILENPCNYQDCI